MAKHIDQIYKQYASRIIKYISSTEFYEYFMMMVEGGKNTIQFSNRKVEKSVDETWVTAIEAAIRPMEEIVNNPRNFIVQEEIIVNVALAKKITPDTVRHLAQHGSMIDRYDEREGVRPNRLMEKSKPRRKPSGCKSSVSSSRRTRTGWKWIWPGKWKSAKRISSSIWSASRPFRSSWSGRLAKEKAVQAEKERIAKEKAREKERAAREKAAQQEKERIARMKAKEKERAAKAKAAQAEKERLAKEKAREKERLAREKAKEKERIAREKAKGKASKPQKAQEPGTES